MSSFTSALIVSPMPSGRRWELMRPFTYHIGSRNSRHIIKVPKGFETDFASIPKFLFFLPYWSKYNKSPVLHDWLYHSKKIQGEKISRKQVDDIFLEAMLTEWQYRRERHIVAWIEYLAVRMFGWLVWKRKTSKSS